MATLRITCTPKDGLQRYEIVVDNQPVEVGSDNEGETEVTGVCGDGSSHRIGYSLFGPSGAKLEIGLACGANTIGSSGDIEVYPEGEPFAAGWQDFQL